MSTFKIFLIICGCPDRCFGEVDKRATNKKPGLGYSVGGGVSSFGKGLREEGYRGRLAIVWRSTAVQPTLSLPSQMSREVSGQKRGGILGVVFQNSRGLDFRNVWEWCVAWG